MADYGTGFDEFSTGASSTNLTGFTVVQATNTTSVVHDLGSGDHCVRHTLSSDGVALITKDGFSTAGVIEIVVKLTLGTTSDQNAQIGPAIVDVATGACYAWRGNTAAPATTWRLALFNSAGSVSESVGTATTFSEPTAGSAFWLLIGRDGSGNIYGSLWIADGGRPGSPMVSVNPTTDLTTVSPGFTTKDSSDDPMDFLWFGCSDVVGGAPESAGAPEMPVAIQSRRMFILP